MLIIERGHHISPDAHLRHGGAVLDCAVHRAMLHGLATWWILFTHLVPVALATPSTPYH
jgi:hypothetical protein